jgi:hypothetical protein
MERPMENSVKPTEISKHIMAINIKQYNQAHLTPFGSGPLAEEMDQSGDSVSAQVVLDGKIPTSLMSVSPLSETLKLLQSLGTKQPSLRSMAIITDDEFIQAYKVTP